MHFKLKQTKLLSAISYFLVAISLLSCNKTPVCDCFDSAGSDASQTRSLPSFNQIVANDNVNVFITTGSPQSVTIEGGKNLIPNIGADVNGNVLTLKNNNICNWLRSYKKSHINVYITMPDLNTITNSGYGTVQSQGTLTFDSLVLGTTNSPGDITLDVNARYINAHMFGTADLTLTGTCQNFFCNYFGGTGFIYNSGLVVTNYAFLSSNTTGDSYLNCTGGLGVQLYGEGNVYYSGNPTSVQSSVVGSGQLIKQ